MLRVAFATATVVLLMGAASCSVPPDVNILPCDPNALFPDPVCLDAGSDAGDAGTDDGGAADAADASSLKAACAGRCTPAAHGDHAGTYMPEAISVWVGPKEIMPTCCPGDEGCEPGGVPTKLYRVFKDIVAPPAECEPCECGASEGTCTELPETIEIRAGLCGQPGVSSLPFNGPAGWDGACSADGALPAGAMCNGVPCAQSIWASPLPRPTMEACAPKKATPSATIEPANWVLGALACKGKPRDEYCKNSDETCYEDPGPGWWQCVYQDGIYDYCPDNFWQTPIVMYPEDAIVDERGCEACSCGEPAGSVCFGKVGVYDDAACASPLFDVPVSSVVEGCVNMNLPGHAVGAKSIGTLGYMPGTCAASGGLPTGTAAAKVTFPNGEGKPGPVTFCCTSFFGLQ